MFWDFLSKTPESVHQLTILFSDRGTPYGYRHMNGYGSHTYWWVNSKGEGFWVKWHFKSMQGIKNLNSSEADQLKYKDADHSTRDLFDSISQKSYPKWKFCAQVMPEKDA